MTSETELLDEIVVVGYGTQKKVNLTGAVESVSGSVLENRPITNIGQGLQGIVPNLNITMNNGGAPGGASNFNIRGTTSLNGGSPFNLVDNVQMDANLVSPEDIESISVLKDAASAAIYGARAAYGVILITTKKGKMNQKPIVQLSTTAYWQNPALSFHNVNSMDF
jgi:TonB-dependent SusC/RagA subfamily outer membrane receptor